MAHRISTGGFKRSDYIHVAYPMAIVTFSQFRFVSTLKNKCGTYNRLIIEFVFVFTYFRRLVIARRSMCPRV